MKLLMSSVTAVAVASLSLLTVGTQSANADTMGLRFNVNHHSYTKTNHTVTVAGNSGNTDFGFQHEAGTQISAFWVSCSGRKSGSVRRNIDPGDHRRTLGTNFRPRACLHMAAMGSGDKRIQWAHGKFHYNYDWSK